MAIVNCTIEYVPTYMTFKNQMTIFNNLENITVLPSNLKSSVIWYSKEASRKGCAI